MRGTFCEQTRFKYRQFSENIQFPFIDFAYFCISYFINFIHRKTYRYIFAVFLYAYYIRIYVFGALHFPYKLICEKKYHWYNIEHELYISILLDIAHTYIQIEESRRKNQCRRQATIEKNMWGRGSKKKSLLIYFECFCEILH